MTDHQTCSITKTSIPSRQFLQPHDAFRLANAALFAERQGIWLNALLTMTWEKTTRFVTGEEREIAALSSEALYGLRKVFARDGRPLHCVWVKERAPTRRTGDHVHALLHLDPARFADDGRKVLRYLRSRHGFLEHGVDLRAHTDGGPGYRTRSEIARQIIYLVKNLDPDARIARATGELVVLRDFLDLDHAAWQAGLKQLASPEPGLGRAWGKTVGTSQNLARSARADAGWIDITSPEDLRDALWKGYSPLNDPHFPPAPPDRAPLRRARLAFTGMLAGGASAHRASDMPLPAPGMRAECALASAS